MSGDVGTSGTVLESGPVLSRCWDQWTVMSRSVIVVDMRIISENLRQKFSENNPSQVKVEFLTEDGQVGGAGSRKLVRNVKGPVRENDVLCLLETEREARRLR